MEISAQTSFRILAATHRRGSL